MGKLETFVTYSQPIYHDKTGGFAHLKDLMGDDDAVCDAARISYGVGTRSISDNRQLIRYLISHHHTSPFEQAEIKFHLRVPMDLMRQLVRQRTASLNEVSSRYSIVSDTMATTDPKEWRSQSKTNKQGSGEFITSWPAPLTTEQYVEALGPDYQYALNEWTDAQTLGMTVGEYLSAKEKEIQDHASWRYKERIVLGVAREQARKDIPLSTYTELYWKIDLHNMLRFVHQRTDPHAQLEIRRLANVFCDVLKSWVPLSYEAFEDYQKFSISLSYREQEAFNRFILGNAYYEMDHKLDAWDKDPDKRKSILIDAGLTSTSERIEFIKKLSKLLGRE